MRINTIIIVIFFTVFHPIFGQENIVWDLSFKNTNTGQLTEAELINEGGQMEWIGLYDNAFVVNDSERGNSLRIAYPEGTVGPPNNGSQFPKKISSSEEYFLDYYVKFEEGFDFKKGGKLPGLTSGGSNWTGGNDPTEGQGWSARYMWESGSNLVVYLYYVDKEHAYGDPIYLDKKIEFQSGKWYRLTQRIKLNDVYTPGNGNGILQVWVDGQEVLFRDDFRFRFEGKGYVDSFYFSTFHGGSDSDWAPSVDSYARFDKFVVSTDIPDFSTDTGTSTNIWKSYNVGIYPNVFNVEFDMKANQNNMDGVTGILQGIAGNYPDLSCIVRFNKDGKIDSYDDDDYSVDVDISYTSSDLFHVMINIDMNTEKYDVYISKNGGDNILLASNYNFRKNSLSMLDTWAIKSEVGNHTVSNMKFRNGGLSNDNHKIYDISIYPNVFSSEFNFTFQANQLLDNHDLKFSLITLSGEVIDTQELRMKNSKTSLSFNSLSNQSSGMFLLLIEGDTFVHTVKLLKK